MSTLQQAKKDKAELKKFQKPPADTPVLPSLKSLMNIEISINDDQKAVLKYDKDLPEPFWWAEYDVDLKQMYFVTVHGKVQGIGFKVFDKMHSHLQSVEHVMTIKMNSKEGAGLPQIIPLVVRHNTLSDG